MSDLILVVEDSVPNRNILVGILKKLNFDVLEASDGQSALKLIDNNSLQSSQKICAVICDIMMPHTDGIELLKEMRGNESFQNLPFIFLTALSDPASIAQGKKYKVDGYLLKPATFDKVSRELKKIFPDRHFPKLGEM